MVKLFSNTVKYTFFILKRERKYILITLIILMLVTLLQAQSFVDLYPTLEERQAVAFSMENPAMIAMMGPVYGKENYTIGALMSNQSLLFTAVAVGVINIILVNRNTRVDEELGRIEVVRSLPVGRLTNILATMFVACFLNFIYFIFIGLGLYFIQVESMNLEGSLLFSAVIGSVGLIFSMITAFFANISSTSRSTLGLSFSILGVSYLVRALGDVTNETLSMMSPLGLVLRSEVYVKNNWQYVIITLIISLIIMVFTLYLASLRDLGRGFLPESRGKESASSFLVSSIGLIVRLLRTSIISWFIALFVLGLSYGFLLGDIEYFFESSEMIKAMFDYGTENSAVDQFITVLMPIVSLISTIPVILSILKVKTEEKTERMEIILSKGTKRTYLLKSSLIVVLIQSVFNQLLFALGFWLASLNVLENSLLLIDTIIYSIVYLPAIWLMVGIAVFLIGCLPKLTILLWIYYAYSFFVMFLGSILQISDNLVKVSQYELIPKLPQENLEYTNLITLTLITTVLLIVGTFNYNKRDLLKV